MFFPQSNGSGDSLGARLWVEKYWKPQNFNSLGFRDTEPAANTPAILFVGDSFTEGHGLVNQEDRFSNIVRRELRKKGSPYQVVNIGIGGLDTNGEFQTMLRFIDQSKIKPHTIVLQYFGNDIEKTAKQKGIIFKGFSSYAEIPGPLLPIVKGSYLFNYLYWYFPKPYEVPYTDFLTAAFNNDEVFAKHVDDLRLFIDYARRNEAKLLVLVFPFMDNLDMSRTMYVDKIINYFKRNSVTVIDVSDAVKQLSLRERIVNFNDGHASAEANGLVAREILKQLSLN